MDKGGGSPEKKQVNVSVCLSVLYSPLKKKGKKRKETPFFVEFTETTFRNLCLKSRHPTVLFVASKTRSARSIKKKSKSEVKNEPRGDCTRAR